MRVLVACEFSGIVRDAFAARGHEAYSCDLLPSERPGLHYMGDVVEILGDDWDLMIAHPPCTHLAVSGARYFARKEREQTAALDFVRALLRAPIERIALENPVSIISTRIRKPDQIIQPWQFGHEETKATCLWLKNLPLLVPTQIMERRNRNLTPSGQNKLGPSPDRWKDRSRTYQGIADAMAEQWGRPREAPRRSCAQCGDTYRPLVACEACGWLVCNRPASEPPYFYNPPDPSCWQEHSVNCPDAPNPTGETP